MFESVASYLRQHHVGVLALFIALSGTAYAATLPRNSVGTPQLKKNAVTAKKIKKNAVTTRKIKDGAVTGAKVRSNSLTGSALNVSTLPKVPSAGTADTANAATTAGVADSLATADVNWTTVTNPGATLTPIEASCDAGFKGISAGLQLGNPDSQFLVDLYPVDLDTWAAHVDNGGTGGNATLIVVCGKVNSVTLPFP